MAVINATVPTLLDITSRLDPNGQAATVAEILNQEIPLVQHMPFKEGNLVTGNRFTQRNSLPTVGFRRINEGVARSKTTARQFDETTAMLEANTMLDRKLAVLNPGKLASIMADNDKAFIEAMGQRFVSTIIYGNSSTAPKELMGIIPRYNSLSGPTAPQIIDAGGTGTDNSSILIVGWDTNKICGIYPKGSSAGLKHFNSTSNNTMGPDGVPIGDEVLDSDGNPYLAIKGHYEWDFGLNVEDPRYIVRIANIDKSLLTKDFSTGADLSDIMVQAIGRMHMIVPGTKIYMPRNLMTFFERQHLFERRAFSDRTEGSGMAAVAQANFMGIPVFRLDAMIADEARVT